MIEALHLLRPQWLLAFLPLAGLVWLLWHRRGSRRGWDAVCDPALLPFVLERSGGRPSRAPALLAAAAGGLGILALAGPAWERLEQPVFRTQSALVLALDVSRSMDSQDLPPSRLARAKHKLTDILKRRREGQTALLVYAAQPFVVTPLTDDTATISALVGSLQTDLMPGGGSRPDLALEQAAGLLRQAGVGHGEVLLLADGAGGGALTQAAERLAAGGHRLHVLGIGTPQGAPIPLTEGGFLKDAAGEIVVPALEEGPLRTAAQGTGGRYRRITLDDGDIEDLLERPTLSAPAEAAEAERSTDLWLEAGPWLLLPLLALAALAFRRGYLALLLVLLPPPPPAQAVDWQSLWLRPDQRAARMLEQGEAARAADLFADPEWKAAAQYRAGHFADAARTLETRDDAEALYNRGNALARSGALEQALAAYDRALEKAPGHEDARYNRALVEQALRRQRPTSADSPAPAGEDQPQPQGGGEKGSQQGPPQTGAGQAGQPRSAEARQDMAGSSQSAADAEAAQGTEPAGRDERSREPTSAGAGSTGQSPPDPGDSTGEAGSTAPPGQQTSTAPPDETAGNGSGAGEPLSEQERSDRQWLRRIPDDPGGLLRRKFLYQYQRMARPNEEPEPW